MSAAGRLFTERNFINPGGAQCKEEEQEAARLEAVFPCILTILPTCIFNKKDPIVLGVEVAEGIAKVGAQIKATTRQCLALL